MALGQLVDVNLALDATLSGGVTYPELPLTNLQLDGQYLQRPARFSAPSNPANTQFEVQMPWPQSINMVGLLFHTLSRQALYRLTIAGADGNLAAPTYQSLWTPVVPRLWRSADLDWGAPNWWTGQPLPRDLDLYPRHRWAALPSRMLCAKLRIEIDDHTNTAAWVDIGGLMVGLGWQPTINFDRGRERGLLARSLTDEAPSGLLVSERRRGRRQLALSWSMLSKADADRLTDMAVRAGETGVVFFAPNLDDPASLLRECFPATFANTPQPKLTYDGLHSATVTLKEVIA